MFSRLSTCPRISDRFPFGEHVDLEQSRSPQSSPNHKTETVDSCVLHVHSRLTHFITHGSGFCRRLVSAETLILTLTEQLAMCSLAGENLPSHRYKYEHPIVLRPASLAIKDVRTKNPFILKSITVIRDRGDSVRDFSLFFYLKYNLNS